MANQRLIAIADAREDAAASEKGSTKTRLTPRERARQPDRVKAGAPHVASYDPRKRTEATVVSSKEAREIHERQAAVAQAKQATIREARETPRTDPRWAVRINPREPTDADSRGRRQLTRRNPNCAISTNPAPPTHDNRGEGPCTDLRPTTHTHPQGPRSANPMETPSTNAKRAK